MNFEKLEEFIKTRKRKSPGGNVKPRGSCKGIRDSDIITAVEARGRCTTKELAEALGCSMGMVRYRTKNLTLMIKREQTNDGFVYSAY